MTAKDLTLEEIDLLWADEDFKKAHSDLSIIHHETIEVKEKDGAMMA